MTEDVLGGLLNLEEVSDLSKVITTMLSDDNIELKTELNAKQIQAFASLATYADKYEISPLQKYLEKFLKLQVSKGRKSRSEVVDMMKAKYQEKTTEMQEIMKALK